jgi:hypothetical protein
MTQRKLGLPSTFVVLDPALMLATHMILREDGHAQERSLFLDSRAGGRER